MGLAGATYKEKNMSFDVVNGGPPPEEQEVLPGLENPRYPPVKAIEFHTRTTSKFYGDDYAVTK